MLHHCHSKQITVVQFGNLNTTDAYRALLNANKYQSAFNFYFSTTVLPLPDKFKLPNGGYDTSSALVAASKTTAFKKLEKPVLFLTDDAIGEIENQNEPDYFFFMSREDDLDPQYEILSTYARKYMAPTRSYEDYLLMMLSTYVLSNYADLNYHDNSRGCFLDYCDQLASAEKALTLAKLCLECEQQIQKRLNNGQISLEQISSAKKLMNKAARRKTCFVIMPFAKELRPRVQRGETGAYRSWMERATRRRDQPRCRRLD